MLFFEIKGEMGKMKQIKTLFNGFTKSDIAVWGLSAGLVLLSFLIFDRSNYLSLISSLIGVTSLIFCAKGNPVGMMLMIIFSVFYGIISFSYSYYGEVMTYLGMTMPMSVLSLVSWLKNPYSGNRSEVKVGRIGKREVTLMLALTSAVTVVFYFILKVFDTANLIPSTVSVMTSFLAVYLTFKRSPYYALAYAANDVVLIILWIMAAMNDISYLSVIICFCVFLVNDLYGFASWRRMQKRQGDNSPNVL